MSILLNPSDVKRTKELQSMMRDMLRMDADEEIDAKHKLSHRTVVAQKARTLAEVLTRTQKENVK